MNFWLAIAAALAGVLVGALAGDPWQSRRCGVDVQLPSGMCLPSNPAPCDRSRSWPLFVCPGANAGRRS